MKLRGLIKDMARRENIDLQDGIYDWSVKAVLLKSYPEIFDLVS